MSSKCSIVENNDELMLMALHTHFLPQQQYSQVYALLLAFHALVYRWGCQLLSLFSQDNEHTELTVLLCVQNPYAISAHILQHYHNFQSNVAIFPSVVQAYTQPYSFGGRIKLICQIRHWLKKKTFIHSTRNRPRSWSVAIWFFKVVRNFQDIFYNKINRIILEIVIIIQFISIQIRSVRFTWTEKIC